MTNSLEVFKNSLAQNIFGATLEEALDTQICIRCKSPIETTDWEPSDIDEWLISGLCPTCFDSITKED